MNQIFIIVSIVLFVILLIEACYVFYCWREFKYNKKSKEEFQKVQIKMTPIVIGTGFIMTITSFFI